jgi:hypothetical protein
VTGKDRVGSKDIVSKNLFKNLVRDFATYLFELRVTDVELPETSNQRIEDRHADLVGKVTIPGEPPFLLHIEIQNDNQATAKKLLEKGQDDLWIASVTDLPLAEVQALRHEKSA